MKYICCFRLIFLFALSLEATAHGPTPQKVIEKIAIGAAPEAVWEQLKDFDQIADWHPLVKKSQGDGLNQPGTSERILTLATGGRITEGLDDIKAESRRIEYRLAKENVKAFPISFYSAVIEVLPGEKDGSLVLWKSRLYRGDTGNFPPPELDDAAAIKAMHEFFNLGLKALKEKLEQTH